MTTWSVRIIKAEIYFIDDIEADTEEEAKTKAKELMKQNGKDKYYYYSERLIDAFK